jgi:hypothetical protein
MKNEPDTKNFFALIRPPFKAILSNGFILDKNRKIVGKIPVLFSTHFESELTNELHCWIVDAMNEKWEREKPHEPEKPVNCFYCKHLECLEMDYYKCKAKGCYVDPSFVEPCSSYEKD